jgi:hypothetical protein
MLTPETVIDILNAAKVKFVLMGNYGLTGWRSQERATEDVDVMVKAQDHAKAVAAVTKAFPQLVMADQLVVTRFADPATGKTILDLMRPLEPLQQQVFKYSKRVGKTHRVPDLEMGLASKFAAIVSPHRASDKRLLDGADIDNIVKHNLTKIDQRKLYRLAELVYQGGGADILKCIDDIRAGEVLDVRALAEKGEMLP